MSTNPYKAFVPFLVNKADGYPDEMHEVSEPTAGDWRRVGLCEPMKGEGLVIDLEGTSRLMAVQFNERILPGKVRDEQLAKEVAKIERLNGRKISKKEYAQLREQVEFDLLPKAFIRRTVVPIMIFSLNSEHNMMLVCTSSAKRAEDCIAVMLGAYTDLKASVLQVCFPVPSRLKALAMYGPLLNERTNSESGFVSHDSIALKGDEKKVIRVKDTSIDKGEVQELILRDEYQIVEMGATWHDRTSGDDGSPVLTFVVNEHLIFKRITTPGITTTMLKEDLYGYTVLCLQTYKRMLHDFIDSFGGMPVVKADEDDDL